MIKEMPSHTVLDSPPTIQEKSYVVVGVIGVVVVVGSSSFSQAAKITVIAKKVSNRFFILYFL